MGMQIGIVGKPNVGKSTFFNAATDAKAEIANYPFTTIDANHGVMYSRKKCPCQHFKVTCTPNNSKCINGIRFIPIEAIDVAGLVPDAYKGKGLGNKFLDELRQADALIHVVDGSGSTDEKGNPCGIGKYNPVIDVDFLEKEINYWFNEIIKKNWELIARKCELEGKKIEELLSEKLTGLGINEFHIHTAIRKTDIKSEKPSLCTNEELINLSDFLRKTSKPMLISLNKCDLIKDEITEKIKEIEKKGYIVVPTSAESELALVNAMEKNLIQYIPGGNDFKIINKEKLSEKQIKALDYIKENVLNKFGSTGVQKCIEKAVEMLDLIVVYPVEDENHLSDKKNRILPDAYFMKKGSTALDLAYKVHTDIGKNFIRAVDAKTKRIIGSDHILNDGDVIRIIADS